MTDTYRILVVDDDFSIVNIIETALKQANYQVLTAHDGETACHIANTKHPHLIIMDVMMPRLRLPHITPHICHKGKRFMTSAIVFRNTYCQRIMSF